jgi:hypothetical protein
MCLVDLAANFVGGTSERDRKIPPKVAELITRGTRT